MVPAGSSSSGSTGPRPRRPITGASPTGCSRWRGVRIPSSTTGSHRQRAVSTSFTPGRPAVLSQRCCTTRGRLLPYGRGRPHGRCTRHRHLDDPHQLVPGRFARRAPGAVHGHGDPVLGPVVGLRPHGVRDLLRRRPPSRQLAAEHRRGCHQRNGGRLDLPVGSDSITAAYSGDVVFGASTSPVLTQVVNQEPTNITITPSSADPEPGQPVTYTATVEATGTGTPTGTVSFTDDGSPVTSCQSLSLPAAAPLQVTCTEGYGSSAAHSIVATYSGDTDDAGSTTSLIESLARSRPRRPSRPPPPPRPTARA